MHAVISNRINPAAVRAYDIRGVVGRQITERDAYALGVAYATVARSRGKREIAVCRDGRLTSEALEDALIDGLMAAGAHVWRVGMGPTPQMYFAVHCAKLDGGIMVTGSHNPPDQNGFKLLLDGEPIFGRALAELVRTEPVASGGGTLTDLSVDGEDCAHAYVERLAAPARDVAAARVVWDCGNGATGPVVEALTRRLPGLHMLLNERVDGRFPAHHPDPAVPENLRQLRFAVVATQADLGIAFDGDGDRIGVVDANGEIVWPDQLLLFLALEHLRATPGTAVVADVKCSRVLFDEVRRLGGRPVMAPSGYVIVREAMLRHKAPLAGEMSGHIVYADCWHATDDALYVAMRLLSALAGRSLQEFRAALPKTAVTPELRLFCPESRKSATLREIAARLEAAGACVDRTDGLRVSVADGWWLLRASGTEPKLTARCEAADEEGLQRLQRELLSHLRQSGLQC